MAQVGAPTQLLPPDLGGGAAAPEAPAAPALPEGIEVDRLDAAGLDYAGTLEAGQGGLGADIWRGTDRIEVERLLPRLRPTVSPALFDLSRRLLLSAAAAPSGRGSGQSLFIPRARLLADMGLVAEALRLLSLMPAGRQEEEAARLMAELAFRAGEVDSACATVRGSVPWVEVDRFWQEALIFCQLAAGETAQASLGLELLREVQGNDPLFFALADALAGTSPAEIPPLPLVTPLYLAMIHAAGLPVPDLAVRSPPPAMLALVAESADAAPERRLEAGEAAALAGLLQPERLAEIYAAQPADAAALDSALDLPDGGATPRDRALLYQGAKRAADPETRLRLVAKALASPIDEPAYWLQVRLHAPMLAELAPTAALAAHAGFTARSLYAVGHFDAARRWLGLLQDRAAGIADAAAALPPLQALDYIAGGRQPVPQLGALLEIRRSQGADLGKSGSDLQVDRLRAILHALDESIEVPASDAGGALRVASAAADIERPQTDLNLWLDLGDAAAQGRVGETVLLSLVELQATGPRGIEPLWLERVIRSLRRVGLDAEERRIAVEAAIANGL